MTWDFADCVYFNNLEQVPRWCTTLGRPGEHIMSGEKLCTVHAVKKPVMW